MKRILFKLSTVLLVVVILAGIASPIFASSDSGNVTILFTHDLHSHLLPTKDRYGSYVGGYARLATLIHAEKNKNPDALVLDAGDFSMGSLFQTSF